MTYCKHCHSKRLCDHCHSLFFDDDIPEPLTANHNQDSKVWIGSGEDQYVNQDGIEAIPEFKLQV